MIVVFVVDTSPSMAAPSSDGNGGDASARGISRLDVAKMSIEHLARGMDKRIIENNRSFLMASAQVASMMAVGRHQQQPDVGRLEEFDEFLLLSTSLQPDAAPPPAHDSEGNTSKGSLTSTSPQPIEVPSSHSMHSVSDAMNSHSSCGAEGRLLVGSLEYDRGSHILIHSGLHCPAGIMVPHPPDRADFERELKRLRPSTIASVDAESSDTFPEWAGGANGLNHALSHGLSLLSRHRLTRGRSVENFGMGRLPWMEHQMTKFSKAGTPGGDDGNAAGKCDSPLQPACLLLLTDGECLSMPPEKGGGDLTLRFGNMPLREFYKEPFRWDQRIFILHICDISAPPLHNSLRALCEVTGGAHFRIDSSTLSLAKILTRIFPPRPKAQAIADPLRLPSMATPAQLDETLKQPNAPSVFVNGGPVCSFQCMEGGQKMLLHRAMILFSGTCEQPRWILHADMMQSTQNKANVVQSPIWCMPESHFPSKKLDTLPPRPSQPLLFYSRNYQAVGSLLFDPYFVMKALHHLEKVQVLIQNVLLNAGENPPSIMNRMLQRDVYICDWLGGDENEPKNISTEPSNRSYAPRTVEGREHFPVCVRGAGRPTISCETGGAILNIGILHVPHDWMSLKDFPTSSSQPSDRLSTLTLLPPDPHILIPLLIKLAETELLVLKKKESNEVGPKSGALAGLIRKNSSTRAIHMDDDWKADFRAYLFRLPHYYLPAIRHVLSPMLPPGILSLLNFDGHESIPFPCYSPICLNKIQIGEKAAMDMNERIRGMEQRIHRSMQDTQLASCRMKSIERKPSMLKKGQNGGGVISFGYGQYDPSMPEHRYLNMLRNLPAPKNDQKPSAKIGALDPIILLPSSCLLAFYESRRRWIFGGSGLTTRGLHIEGVNNDGVNVHHYNRNQKIEDERLITLAGVGADETISSPIARMGDFKERLSFAPTNFVNYCGCSSAVGAAVTTASDGSPKYSVDDDVLPVHFFDAASGEFMDSPQARSRARLMINFGNPFHDKRGGSVVPERFSSQRPPLHKVDGPSTPPGSFESQSLVEGEGEAAFTGKKPSPPSSPPRSSQKIVISNQLSTVRKRETDETKQHEPAPKRAKQIDVKLKPKPPSSAPASSRPPPPPPSRPPPPPRKNSFSGAPPPPPPKLGTPIPDRLKQNCDEPSSKTPKKSSFSGTPPPPPPKPISGPLKQKGVNTHSRHLQANQSQQNALQVHHKPIGELSALHKNSQQRKQDLTIQSNNPDAKLKERLPEGCLLSPRNSEEPAPHPLSPTSATLKPPTPLLRRQTTKETNASVNTRLLTPAVAPLVRNNSVGSNTSVTPHLRDPQANLSQQPAPPASPKPLRESSTSQYYAPVKLLEESFALHTDLQQKQKEQQQQQDVPTQLHNPDAKPTIKLPDGWECFWSKSQQRWYFFDIKTNKSVWDIECIKAEN